MEKLLKKLLNLPWIVVGLTIIISALFFMQMKQKSRMETDLDKYMPQDHPAFVYSDQAEEWFGINDGIIVAIENQNGIYNKETLDVVKLLTKRFQKMKEIEKADVTSLYTADNIVGTEDGMDVKAFFKKVPTTDEGLNEIAEKVRANEMIFGRLVSENETVTVIIAEIGDDVFSQEFYHQILELVHSFEGPEKLYVAGIPIVEGSMAYLGPKDMKKMVPIVFLVIIIVLFALLRNLKSTFLILSVVSFSSIWAFGLMAAIPLLIVHAMLTSKTGEIIDSLEQPLWLVDAVQLLAQQRLERDPTVDTWRALVEEVSRPPLQPRWR